MAKMGLKDAGGGQRVGELESRDEIVLVTISRQKPITCQTPVASADTFMPHAALFESILRFGATPALPRKHYGNVTHGSLLYSIDCRVRIITSRMMSFPDNVDSLHLSVNFRMIDGIEDVALHIFLHTKTISG